MISENNLIKYHRINWHQTANKSKVVVGKWLCD